MISLTRRPEKTLPFQNDFPFQNDYRKVVSTYAAIYRSEGLAGLRNFIQRCPMPSYTKFATLHGLDLQRSERIRYLDLYADMINDARLPQLKQKHSRIFRKAFNEMLELLS